MSIVNFAAQVNGKLGFSVKIHCKANSQLTIHISSLSIVSFATQINSELGFSVKIHCEANSPFTICLSLSRKILKFAP